MILATNAIRFTTKPILTVSTERGNAQVKVTGVGGDYFRFHPLKLRSGSYLMETDLMKDRVLLDEELAWKLFGGMELTGSQQNDIFYNKNGKIALRTNRSGGIQGGISNGEDIYFRVAFKPVATVLMEQPTVDKDGNETVLKAKGRHDPCIVPRAVPVIEAAAAIAIFDAVLMANKNLE